MHVGHLLKDLSTFSCLTITSFPYWITLFAKCQEFFVYFRCDLHWIYKIHLLSLYLSFPLLYIQRWKETLLHDIIYVLPHLKYWVLFKNYLPTLVSPIFFHTFSFKTLSICIWWGLNFSCVVTGCRGEGDMHVWITQFFLFCYCTLHSMAWWWRLHCN